MDEKHVFINCPFDQEHKPILDSITFCVHDCGFIARSALKEITSTKYRLDKILEVIEECKYGIHDISSIEFGRQMSIFQWIRDGKRRGMKELPHFNMSFELGLFYGAMFFGVDSQKDKELLLLDSEEHRYQMTLSDFSGKESFSHNDDPLMAISYVRSFLIGKTKDIPGSEFFQRRFIRFQRALPSLAENKQHTLAELRSLNGWGDLVNLMVEWQKTYPKTN